MFDRIMCQTISPLKYPYEILCCGAKQSNVKYCDSKTIKLPKLIKNEEDLSPFSFSKFCAIYFNTDATYTFSRKPLKTSLLYHNVLVDVKSSQALWITILRLMGDMPDSKCNEKFSVEVDNKEFNCNLNKQQSSTPSVMKNLTVNLTKIRSESKHLNYAVESLPENNSIQKRLFQKTLKKSTKLPVELQDSSELLNYYKTFLCNEKSNLEKIHFIIGHGVLKPQLRDEIYCQICKQIKQNPNQASFNTGWILLLLCLGCFPPSLRFEKYLRSFISYGPQLYSSYCENQLNRTLKNGLRSQPPSLLELQAIRNNNRFIINLSLMDDSTRKLQIDSASTAREVVEEISKSLGLQDIFGFSITVKSFQKIMSLGNGREHIMDAISKCEQYAKEQGNKENDAQWKLYFRKETFSPWYNPSEDELTTNLIYEQVVRGINSNEYRCNNEEDIVVLCALRYYVENGQNINSKILEKLLPLYLPKYLLETDKNSISIYVKLIIEAFIKKDFVKNNIDKKLAKENIVLFAQLNWPMTFSRFFEALKFSGSSLSADSIIIAINSCGLYFLDSSEQILIALSYVEIVSVVLDSFADIEESSVEVDEITLKTIQNESYRFKCYESKDVYEVLNCVLSTLKAKSIYVVVNQTITDLSKRKKYLDLMPGDLIKLDKKINGEFILKSEIFDLKGECIDGRSGLFPSDCVYVLPTILKPDESILKWFKKDKSDLQTQKKELSSEFNKNKVHTLEKFAAEYFQDLNELPSLENPDQILTEDNLVWKHSTDIKHVPLLKDLKENTKAFENAIEIFKNILMYMGDKARNELLIDPKLIFESCLDDRDLKDEIFCQLMKQLTDNTTPQSEERGWDLMWMATGIMYPTSAIFKELLEFLNTRSHPLATESLKRLRKTAITDERKYPSHIVEVESIQNRSAHIFHKIYFPDESTEAIEIQSSTRAKDVILEIVERLDLKSSEGYGMFAKAENRLVSLPDNEFIFDFLTELMEKLKSSTLLEKDNESSDPKYRLYFMKKLWINVKLGENVKADLLFYFPHVLFNYLKGFYKISKNEAIKIGALLYKINNNEQIQSQNCEFLETIMPKDVLILLKGSTLKKSVSTQLKTLKKINEIDDLKRKFIQEMSKKEMFGATFFEVKQTNHSNIPETILIAINDQGFHIINYKTKNLIYSYKFSEINLWSSGTTSFHIRFGNMTVASKLLCITEDGYKIDDLLSSYIDFYK